MFFAILILLFCLQLQKMRSSDKRKRNRTNLRNRVHSRSNISNFHSQLQINGSRTNLPQINAVTPGETVINLEIPNLTPTATTEEQNLDVREPVIPCHTFEDLLPVYEAPPSYNDCVPTGENAQHDGCGYDSWQFRYFYWCTWYVISMNSWLKVDSVIYFNLYSMYW